MNYISIKISKINLEKKILLFGFTASGKTQFNKLVDGHSKISVMRGMINFKSTNKHLQ